MKLKKLMDCFNDHNDQSSSQLPSLHESIKNHTFNLNSATAESVSPASFVCRTCHKLYCIGCCNLLLHCTKVGLLQYSVGQQLHTMAYIKFSKYPNVVIYSQLSTKCDVCQFLTW